ncbi:efflux transporter outer membrane subunit [Pseudodonghicola flavimaris]|uniref:Efflux transporter outer membrane subunit n=1 Tax=Pseudodonghicola flavimaris TaxID=3050036 RepID=A0ABT7F3S7_9RHOB|nr:efflux transporter outer membrane subunit [Pseudodonghicola flavimaris]MDK3019253.1 efflux transporter outer membrane subunit [Pseudodonghicola flavimaris]
MKYASLSVLVLLTACTVGPRHQVPQATVQQRFIGGDAATVGAVAQQRWWEEYRDRELSALIGTGLQQNLDSLAAMERIREAQARLRATGVNAAMDGALETGRSRSGGDATTTGTATSSGLSASFVIDLFGGIRRGRDSALAGLAGAQADLDTTALAWVAELIAAYADARYNQEALALTRETIRTREQTLEITRQKYDAGAATEYEVAEAEASLASARAALPQYNAAFSTNVFAIGTLLNTQSGPILARMQRGAPQLRIPAPRGSGVPADLLRNRPDIRSAEAALAAAVAEAGVSEAELYPALTLSGSVARVSSTDSWSFGPVLSLPVFNQGALAANRDAAVSAARQAAIDWQAAVLTAVEDVQVAQAQLTQYRQRAVALRRAAEAYDRALQLAQQNYRDGAITLLDLLDTDRSAASARISAASAANDAAKAWATLRIAIGAGAGALRPVPEPAAPAADTPAARNG